MLSAVFFDLDGVIVNSEPPQMKVFDMLLKKEGISLDKSDFFEYTGKRTIDNFKDIVKRFGLKKTPEEYTALKDKLYFQLLKEGEIFPNDDAVLLIKELYKERVPLALVSGSPKRDIEYILSCLNLEKIFQTIISAEDVKNGKPDPEGYLLAATVLSVSPDKVWVIEDSFSGVLAAKRGKFNVIAVPTLYTKDHDFSLADVVFEKFSEVRNFLMKLVNKNDLPTFG